MKIFIIGGTGVLSTDIVKECLNHKDEVYILNRGRHKEDVPNDSNCHLIIGDIRDSESVRSAVDGLQFDVVIDFLSFRPSQLDSTYKIFAPLCKQYVFISTCCVFQRKPEDGVITEESPKPNQIISYGYEKYQCELLLKRLNKEFESNYTIIRPYITYGNTRIPFGLAPLERYHWTMIGRILSDKPFFIWDDGTNKCNFLNTCDFARLFYLLLLNPKAYNQDVNITGNVIYEWKDLLDILYDFLGKNKNNIVSIPQKIIAKELPEYEESLLGDRALDGVFDTSKLREIAPQAEEIYQSSLNLREGIRRTVESYKEKQYYKGIDFRYDARVDRMIANYLPYKDQRRKNIRFVDYLGNCTKKDRMIYQFFRLMPNYMISLLAQIKHKIKGV